MKKLKKILGIKWFKSVLGFIHFFIILHSFIVIIWVFLTRIRINTDEFFKDFILFDFQNVFFKVYFWLLMVYLLMTVVKLIIKRFYFNKVVRKHQKEIINISECPLLYYEYKFSHAFNFKAIKESFKSWWDEMHKIISWFINNVYWFGAVRGILWYKTTTKT
ncbi:hypothetical protein [Spiroplasma endosymbiont of Agriotes lineatus]|uniref:hypothetical protein n=1 Tax=Spiroplasma endosymbiont of Agriotes lineatus TaxID=3077930 RepID=UPI0030CC7516